MQIGGAAALPVADPAMSASFKALDCYIKTKAPVLRGRPLEAASAPDSFTAPHRGTAPGVPLRRPMRKPCSRRHGMAYWCDDRALLIEQRRLDAAQEEARRKIEVRGGWWWV